MHTFTAANGLDEPGLENRVLNKYTSDPDDLKQTFALQRHGIPYEQGQLFKNGILDADGSAVLRGRLQGDHVDSHGITDALYKALLTLDYTLPAGWGPKSHGPSHVSAQVIPATEDWKMTMILINVDGPHKAHIVATLLTLSELQAIVVDDTRTDDKHILELELAGIPLPR